MGLTHAQLLSVSSTGEMAVLLDSHPLGTWVNVGTLARMPLAGGAPREVVEQVQWADWSPDGTNLAVVRDAGGKNRLEYPVGKVLYETGGWISHPRVSPKGDMVAFLDHPVQGDDSGSVAMVDLHGNKKMLAGEFYSSQGLAWSPEGKEVWFTASKTGTDRPLYAVSLSGNLRLVARMPGTLSLLDIWKDGRILLNRASWRRELDRAAARRERERDLSWLDYSYPADISADGKTLLFDEEGVGGGHGVFQVRRADLRGVHPQDRRLTGGAAGRRRRGGVVARREMGHCAAADHARAAHPAAHRRRRIPPVDQGRINHSWARWLPDGKQFVFTGNDPTTACAFTCRTSPAANRGRSARKELTAPRSWSRPMAALWPASVLTSAAISIPSRRGEAQPVHGLPPGDQPIY